jgi:hypothetical protein
VPETDTELVIPLTPYMDVYGASWLDDVQAELRREFHVETHGEEWKGFLALHLSEKKKEEEEKVESGCVVQ